ncbi:MAG: S8 family serine peptidase [Pseudomonadota bacterium]
MNNTKYRGLGSVLLAGLLAACATPTVGDVTEAVIADNALLIVIDDPRGELRRRGVGPGYAAPQAYSDDPLLRRRAAEIANDYGLSIIEQWPLRNIGVHCFVVERPNPATITAINVDKRVRWTQSFNEFTLQSSDQARTEVSVDPNCVVCRFASEFNNGGRDVVIAVIDTAVDVGHPDLYRSSLTVKNFAGQRGNPKEEKHGTAVVGLIAAMASDEKGVNGVAPDANVHLLRACWQERDGAGRCNTLTLALALDAAIDLRPDILNLSLSGRRDRVLDELIQVLLNNGTLVVAAYDEQRRADARFPSHQEGVIYAYGIERGVDDAMIDNVIFAPKHALSLSPMAGYALVSGHSIATPQLSAMAARLMALDKDASRQRIVGELSGWLDRYYAPPDAP